MKARKRTRGAGTNPPNRFEALHRERLELQDEEGGASKTQFLIDSSRSILARNDSPDIPFTYSLNPYRGCEHGCIYCYARPSHEYLGFSAGIDFESKIMVKTHAPELLAEAFESKSWNPQVVALSGNTDCYQPVERKLGLTRQCLEVFHRYGNPVSMITKNALLLRDLDILRSLARENLIHVLISITSLDADLLRVLEPRTSAPNLRLQALEELASNGIPVGVNVAPVIPGLNDQEIPSILRESAARGATMACSILLRLPGPVKDLFHEWLQKEMPERAKKITSLIRQTREGAMSDSRFGSRMSGTGEVAGAIHRLFALHAARYGLQERWPELSTARFRRRGSAQQELFTR